jgi:alpha-tubulin suppressor-like RCC1 family protein
MKIGLQGKCIALTALAAIGVAFTSSTASSQSSTGIPCAGRADAVIANTGQALFNSGTLVDSYNSNLGAYGGSNVGSAGNVQAATSITLNSGAVVHGKVTPNTPAGLAAVSPPAGATNLGSFIVNSGQTTSLAAGDYVASSLTLNSNSTLNVTGTVRIWVTGALVLGGAANRNGVPSHLQFLVTDNQFVNVNSGATVAALIYAPLANVNVNATVFGSVVGAQTSILNSGAAVHYDTSAACSTAPPSTLVSAGTFSACAVRPGGTVECWGDNNSGDLGIGNFTGPQTCQGGNACSPSPVTVSNLSGATSVGTGFLYACAILAGGNVECWGHNAANVLANNDTNGPQTCGTNGGCSTVPFAIAGVSNATQLATGGIFACALIANGTIECWGAGGAGQLGNGSAGFPPGPVQVQGITNAVAVSAGFEDACALLATGVVECWGNNQVGQIGNGTFDNQANAPVPVPGITSAVAVGVGLDVACAVLANGTVQCWGNNAGGQLGIGTNSGPQTCTGTACSTTPVTVSGLTNAVAVSIDQHACALLSNGTIACWGDNSVGELGDGTLTTHLAPEVVPGVSGVSAVTVGGGNTCVRLTSGAVECWGSASSGENGNGNTGGPNQCPNALNPCADTPQTVTF